MGYSVGIVYLSKQSTDFENGHLAGSIWKNLSELLNTQKSPSEPITIINKNIEQAVHTADILKQQGWQIAGIAGWKSLDFKPSELQTAKVDNLIDQSTLFAGRHYGNMQDSRDYLSWEEALPEQIDSLIYQQWMDKLT